MPQASVISPEDWQRLVTTLGLQRARQWLASQGGQYIAPSDQPELPAVNPTQPPVYQQPLAAAQPPAPQPAPQGNQPVPNPPTGALPGSFEDLFTQQNALGNELLQAQTDIAKRRAAYYDTAAEDLKKRRFGPSQAEQLFALAAAIGKPTYDRSFGSIMANVTPTLSQLAQANREAAEQRSEMQRKLMAETLSSDEASKLALLEQRQKNLNAAGSLFAAANKPQAAYSYQLDQSGNVREVPKPSSVRRPTTKAEYDAIKPGEYYVVPSGPDAGKVVRKMAGGF